MREKAVEEMSGNENADEKTSFKPVLLFLGACMLRPGAATGSLRQHLPTSVVLRLVHHDAVVLQHHPFGLCDCL